MKRTPVTSSQIRSIGHNSDTNEMDVEFVSHKKVKPGEKEPLPNIYRYRNVSTEEFAAFLGAESKGRHFRDYIKALPGSYPYRKLSPEEAAPEEKE